MVSPESPPRVWSYIHLGAETIFTRADRTKEYWRLGYSDSDARTLVEYLNSRSLSCAPNT
jgi:hypothetical protein